VAASTPERANEPLEIGGELVQPGETRRLEVPVAQLPTRTELNLPLTVVHGASAGPRLWLSAAVHGDELNGVEVIRQALARLSARALRGTVIAAPIVNVFGFNQQARLLPDGRDLNRSFPGSRKGSLAARLASIFMHEVVDRCTHGIDFHTGARERDNLPQVRARLDDPEVRRIALAFGAPVVLHSEVRPGSLRDAAHKRGIPAIVYEAGEAQRFDPRAIRLGVRGVLRVLQALGALAAPRSHGRGAESLELRSSTWIRATRAGVLRLDVDLGARTSPRQALGVISDPYGEQEVPLLAPSDGVVIGLTRNPVVHRGDAVVHVGSVG